MDKLVKASEEENSEDMRELGNKLLRRVDIGRLCYPYPVKGNRTLTLYPGFPLSLLPVSQYFQRNKLSLLMLGAQDKYF